MNNIINTADGSNTLHSEKFNEQYHSAHGAIQESMHVFINAGLNYCQKQSIKIFEVGFGTGLNAILTFIESCKKNITIEYTAVELYPVHTDTIAKLNYNDIFKEEYHEIYNQMHACKWNNKIQITDKFNLQKLNTDFTTYCIDQKYDIIYFDAFAPETQPEMWSEENFTKLYNSLNMGGNLTTYSSKGIVKNNLRNSGFIVKRLPGPVGKRHIIRAIKQ